MIQIDMPMPTNCLDCPACNEYLICAIPVGGRKWGENDVREYGNGRPDWCPMKELEAVVQRREGYQMDKSYYQYHFINGKKIKCCDFSEYRSHKDAVEASEKERKRMRLSDNWETVITRHCRFEIC